MYTFHFSLLVPSLYLFCVHTSVRRPTTDHVCLPHSLSTLFCCVRICAVSALVCIVCVYVCVCVCVCVCTCVHWPIQAFVRSEADQDISLNLYQFSALFFETGFLMQPWIWHFDYTGYWRVSGICQFLHLNAGVIATEKRNLVFTWMLRIWTQVLMLSSRHLTQWAISSNIRVSL